MITNEDARKAIEKYQKEHPLHFGTMFDVTTVSSKEGADIISQTIERVRKKVDEDTELWCICEMAKMYMQGVKPVYPVRPQGKWYENIEKGLLKARHGNYVVFDVDYLLDNLAREVSLMESVRRMNCGADMRGES